MMGHSNCDKCGHDKRMCVCDKGIANKMQVGGDHYRSEYQHWDWAIDIRLGYLESAATKYVTRWRGKKGCARCGQSNPLSDQNQGGFP